MRLDNTDRGGWYGGGGGAGRRRFYAFGRLNLRVVFR